MGSAKASLLLGGAPLLAHVVSRLCPFVGEIVVVAAPDQQLPAIETSPDVSVRTVRDRLPHRGPLRALGHGLTEIASPAAFAIGCDSPFLTPALLDLLAREIGNAEGLIPSWNGRPQPLVAIYRTSLGGAIESLLREGETRLQAIARLPTVRLLAPDAARTVDPEGMSFATVNTPSEYAQAVRFFESTRR